jgi:hypothetical protein
LEVAHNNVIKLKAAKERHLLQIKSIIIKNTHIMAKYLHFFIRFMLCLSLLGAHNFLLATELNSPVDTCMAPAPDSFRVTVVGTNFATLAWVPAWPGALHAIEVEKEEPNGSWEPISIYTHVPGESFTVSGLESGAHYRAFIATYCDSLEVSSLKDDTDFSTLIVELSIAGRNPVNPVPVNCKNIAYADHEWIGFRVTNRKEAGDVTYNFFEVTRPDEQSPQNSMGKVKRVFLNNRIVAMNLDKLWPTLSFPRRESDNPFNMAWLKPNGLLDFAIGRIELIMEEDYCDICPVGNWHSAFKFDPMVAEAVFSNSPDDDRSSNSSNKDCFIQNLFSDQLKVQLPFEGFESRDINVRLISMDGKTHFQTYISSQDGVFTINTESLKPQMFVLILQYDQTVLSKRVLKIK